MQRWQQNKNNVINVSRLLQPINVVIVVVVLPVVVVVELPE